MVRQQGFVFILTLGTLLIISLLICTSLQQVLIYYKALSRQELAHQQRYQLERLAMGLLGSLEAHQSCFSKKSTTAQILNKLRQHQGCHLQIEQSRYDYLIEDLGFFPCLRIRTTGLASHHFRISLWQTAPSTVSNWLQLRFIQSATGFQACKGETHFISTGVSSWRYLTD